MMRAAYTDRNGMLTVGDWPQPQPQPRPWEVVVAVGAVSVNPVDWKMQQRLAWLGARLGGRLPRRIVCEDLSGTVVAVGKRVRRFQPGDPVLAMLPAWGGAAAQWVALPATFAQRRPATMDVAAAAGLPLAGLTAWQALQRLARVRAGQRLLVIGAAGGVGHLAVQIGRAAGATVTGVCGTGNVALVRALGAETVIDYRTDDVHACGERFDIVYDTIGNETLARCRALLRPGGVFVSTAPNPRAIAAAVRDTPIPRALTGDRAVARSGFCLPLPADLAALCALAASGRLRTVVDSTHDLERIGDAWARSRSGHARGKVIVTLPAVAER